MEIVDKKCENCGKNIYVQEEFVREQMFCTLGCMDEFKKISFNVVCQKDFW